MSTGSAIAIYEFGEFELDLRTRELRFRGELRRLEPKAFDLLVYLVEHRARVVSSDELRTALWNGECLCPGVLPQCVWTLRRALGDDARRQVWIKTAHRRGYRFVGFARGERAAHAGPLLANAAEGALRAVRTAERRTPQGLAIEDIHAASSCSLDLSEQLAWLAELLRWVARNDELPSSE